MSLSRCVQAELLDHLAENDPSAIRSRADLRRINLLMGARAIMLRALRNIVAPKRVIELGAGDGTLMLGLAKSLAQRWPDVHLTLLDRQSLVAPATVDAFHGLGWRVELLNIDVLDWIREAPPDRYDLATANLFLHHFDGEQLGPLLSTVAERSDTFLACEPRRAWRALAGSHMVGLIGANAVTREDAVLSVHAGFADSEITTLWQREHSHWHLQEYAAGLFSHCFLASRLGA